MESIDSPTKTLGTKVSRDFSVAPRVMRRSRWFACLLVFNWGFLGFLMYTIGSENRLIFGVCFAAGLLCFATAVGQFRAIRLSAELPLVRLYESSLVYRPYSSRTEREIELAQINRLDTTDPKTLDLLVGAPAQNEERVLISLSELSSEDGANLAQALGESLQSLASGT